MTHALSNLTEPIFHFSPRTLVELSSLRVALNLWLHEFNEFYPPKNTSYVHIAALNVDSKNLTKVPHKIRKIIDAWFHPLTKQLYRWISYSKNVSGNFSYHRFYTRFDLVVFGGDGRVHFKNTVMNFLEDDSLDNITKFEMACVYCVEEKIDLLWPLVSYTLSIDYLLFDNNFMLYYWICRKKDELNRIPLQGFSRIELLMINTCCGYSNWSAVLYFLSLLDVNDILPQINEFFEVGDRFEFTIDLLPFLEAPIQLQVVNSYSADILAAFIEDGDTLDHAIQVWLHIKDRLTGDQFYHDVIRRFIHIKNRDGNMHVESILAEVWYSSAQHLKQFILNFHFQNVVTQMTYYNENLLKNLSRDISFLLAILLDADIDLRKKFWDENWSKFIEGVSPAQLDRLMALCLTENEVIEGFKRQLEDTDAFTEYCDALIGLQYSSELNEFLCYLYPDQEVRNIKVKLLNSNYYWKFEIFQSRDVEQIQKYIELVDNLFSDHILAENFKNQFICEENFQHLCDALAEKSFLDVKFIVESFASSKKLVELKETLLSMFRDMLINGGLFGFNEIDGIDGRIFLTWCVDDQDQRIEYFMKSLPIDEIFETAFLNCLKYNPKARKVDLYKTGCLFMDLKAFLRWYFESSDLCENFIRRKIKYYGEMFEGDVKSIFNMDKKYVVEKLEKEFICYGHK